MEIQALLTCCKLPRDIVIQEIYGRHLYKMKSQLTSKLKDDIVHDRLSYERLKKSYRSNTEDFSTNPDDDDYYMYWMENDIGLVLNDGIALIHGISEQLKSKHHSVDLEFLTKIPIGDEKIDEHMFEMWKMMDTNKRNKLISGEWIFDIVL